MSIQKYVVFKGINPDNLQSFLDETLSKHPEYILFQVIPVVNKVVKEYIATTLTVIFSYIVIIQDENDEFNYHGQYLPTDSPF